MRCAICKAPVPTRLSHFCTLYRTRTGKLRYRYWCSSCDESEPEKVEALVKAADKTTDPLQNMKDQNNGSAKLVD